MWYRRKRYAKQLQVLVWKVSYFLAVLELFIQTIKKWTKQQYTRLNQQSIKRVKKWRAKHRNRQKHPKLQSLLLSQHWARRVVQISTRTRNEDERVSRSILKVRIFICEIINIFQELKQNLDEWRQSDLGKTSENPQQLWDSLSNEDSKSKLATEVLMVSFFLCLIENLVTNQFRPSTKCAKIWAHLWYHTMTKWKWWLNCLRSFPLSTLNYSHHIGSGTPRSPSNVDYRRRKSLTLSKRFVSQFEGNRLKVKFRENKETHSRCELWTISSTTIWDALSRIPIWARGNGRLIPTWVFSM